MKQTHEENENEPLQQKNASSKSVKPLAKKPRLEPEEREPSVTSTHAEATPSPLLRIPLELLAEILIHTSSPKHVLAVARTSKFFCYLLLDPSLVFVWRSVREVCRPLHLPEPFSTFTEASYASFVFDGGYCEICKRPVNSMYTSFALRLRLCHRSDCRNTFRVRGVKISPVSDHAIAKCIPRSEEMEITAYGIAYGLLLQSPQSVFRAADWVAELTEFDKCGGEKKYIANKGRKIEYISKWMEFCMTLGLWKENHHLTYRSICKTNETFGRELAQQHGWEYWDLYSFTPYGAVHRRRSRLLEYVTQCDYNLVAPEVEPIIAKLTENRIRRDREAAHMQKRLDIERHYNRLRSQKPSIILPPLAAFRELPPIVMLQTSATLEDSQGSEVYRALVKDQGTRMRLESELKQWEKNARMQLGTVLGYPHWSTSSNVVLHPCDRVTAWFRCTRCATLPHRHMNEECLDFAGACAHECVGLSKAQRRDRKAWDAGTFIKDDKASAVMSQLLESLGVDGACKETRPLVEKLGLRIVCLSCEPPLLMGPESVVGHCHRHDEMKISLSLLPATGTSSNYEFGLVKRLLGFEPKARHLQALSIYGCRHCSSAETEKRVGKRRPRGGQKLTGDSSGVCKGPQTRTPDDNQAKSTGQSGDKMTQPCKYIGAFTFNGLRSHLSNKHNIKNIRDEDLFCYEPLDWTSVNPAK